VTNKGNNFVSTDSKAWDGDFKWNRFRDYCAYYNADSYFIESYHTSNDNYDFISISSTEGFKNTGFDNGINHLKCFYTSGTAQANKNLNASAWVPDFESEEGVPIIRWKHTGVA